MWEGQLYTGDEDECVRMRINQHRTRLYFDIKLCWDNISTMRSCSSPRASRLAFKPRQRKPRIQKNLIHPITTPTGAVKNVIELERGRQKNHRLKGSMDSSLQRSQQANSHKVQWQWSPCCLQEAMTPTWPAVGTHLGKSLERGLSSTTVTLGCAPLGRSALI